MNLQNNSAIIFVFLVLLKVTTVISQEACTLSDGEQGVCVPVGSCERDRDAITFDTDFCGGDFSKICCESDSLPTTRDNQDENDYEGHVAYKQFDSSKCGALSGSNRISGGQIADLIEFPWAALIGYLDEVKFEFKCGGSLISDYFVLSAAHCFKRGSRLRDDIISVRLGEYRKSTEQDCEEKSDGKVVCADPVQDIEIDEEDVVIHPEFGRGISAHDIALVRLPEAAHTHQNNIKPICLPFEKRFLNLPSSMIVIGFGRTETSESSDVLRKVIVNTVSNQECMEKYAGARVTLTVSQFCAGDVKDSCKGDSGSSIQRPFKYAEDGLMRYVQLGIVSFGTGECGSSTPGVYTKVQSYLPWILDSMK